MKNFKYILNLPKTKFSMRGNLSKKEPNILKKWNDNNIYQLIRYKNKNKKKFFLNDGPPYANGNIHIGHAVNKILKDIIIKFKNLSGFDANYTPSWDCHGLPIEQKVEKEIRQQKQTVTPKEFRQKCRNYAQTQVDIQKIEFMRLGIFGDWDNSYLTMNFKNEANIIRVLYKMIKEGYIYKDFKPVHWCVNCQSALAEAEVEYYEKSSTAIIIKLKSVNNYIIENCFNVNICKKDIYLTVWTTTPWTIPASKAITLHPNFEYQLIETQHDLLIISKKLVYKTMEKIRIKQWKILNTIKGNLLKNLKFFHPFLNTKIPIILAEHVTQQLGTGAIHTAPEFGQDDYIVCKKNNISITQTIDGKGNFLKNIHSKLTEVNIFESTSIILELLKNNNSLLNNEKIFHSYPHCWRHKTPIISRATQQWFIDINHNDLRNRCIEYIKQVSWIPTWSKNRMIEMISNRPDWCISRQRKWGVPIPIFIHKKTGSQHPDTLLIITKMLKHIEKHGIQSWFDTKKDILDTTSINNYKKVEDVLDVWFESGSIQLSNVYNIKNIEQNNVSDICIEGLDQHRGWFMSSLIISAAINHQASYKTVITHGFVVDKNKKKMSKSIGNTIRPQDIINTLGADILRLWTASTNYTKEISISNDSLKRTSDCYRRIRNTARFFLSNLNEFDPQNDLIDPDKMILLDKWAVSQAFIIQKNIINSYSNYNFNDVVQYLMKFCSKYMGGFYLEIIKDRQYTSQPNSIARKSCQTAMYLILDAFIKWISPILSFTADELWDYLPGKKSKFIFTEEWSNNLFNLHSHDVINHNYWNKLITIKNEVNKALEHARKTNLLNNSLEASVTLYVDNDIKNYLKILKHELKFLFLTSEIKILNSQLAPNDALNSSLLKNFKIQINKMSGKKCPRCWHIFSINNHENNHNICIRCISNTIGLGEIRKFL